MIFAGCASEEEEAELLEELLELDEEDELEELAALELGLELPEEELSESLGALPHPPSVPVTDTASAVTPAIFKNSRRFNSFAIPFSSCLYETVETIMP